MAELIPRPMDQGKFENQFREVKEEAAASLEEVARFIRTLEPSNAWAFTHLIFERLGTANDALSRFSKNATALASGMLNPGAESN